MVAVLERVWGVPLVEVCEQPQDEDVEVVAVLKLQPDAKLVLAPEQGREADVMVKLVAVWENLNVQMVVVLEQPLDVQLVVVEV